MASGSFHEDFSAHSEVRSSSNRSFGFVVAGALTLIGVAPLLRGGRIRVWSLAAAIAFASIATVAPGALSRLNRWWTALGLLLGKIVNPLVLSLLYYTVFTPIALLMKAFGKDPLNLKAVASATSYWIERQAAANMDSATMRQQF
jgi:hypothetical protein